MPSKSSQPRRSGPSLPSRQRAVAQFVRRHGLETDVAHRLLDVVSELGEVAKEVLKGSAYGSARFVAPKEWTDELGDVVFSLMCVANTTGVDLDEALQGALEKYRRRLSQTGAASSHGKKRA